MTSPSSFIHRLHAFSDRTNRLTELALVCVGSAMVLVISLQVFSRYILNHSLFWSEEVGRICLVWITFLGGSAAYKRHAHVGIDFFVSRLPSRAHRLSGILVQLLSLAFFVLLICYGLAFVWFVSGQRTPALGIPSSLPYLVIPLSGFLFFLHGVDNLLTILHPVSSTR